MTPILRSSVQPSQGHDQGHRRRGRFRLPTAVAALAAALGLGAVLGGCRPGSVPFSGPVSIGVYSGRHYNTDQALYRRFTEQTGIQVKLLEGKDDALIERVRSEGSRTPADLLVLVDAARLVRAADQGLFQPVNSDALRREVPPELRDSAGRWSALTRRVRVVVVNPKQVDPALILSLIQI